MKIIKDLRSFLALPEAEMVNAEMAQPLPVR